ncbi:MAG: NAD(P)H-hydrate epimerase [Candidatus Hadarchaeales archaeon]
MRAITPDEMRRIEERAERMGVSRLMLMENAGKAVADFIASRMDPAGRRVAVICGTGNNGGDGLVAARHLAAYGFSVEVFLVGRREDVKTPEASHNLRVVSGMPSSIRLLTVSDPSFMDELRKAVEGVHVIVDAIFGTGIRGELGEPYASVIDLVNGSRAFKVAVDVPSGLDPLTGRACGRTVRADVTITFHRMKVGLLERGEVTGPVIVANIGVPPDAEAEA